MVFTTFFESLDLTEDKKPANDMTKKFVVNLKWNITNISYRQSSRTTTLKPVEMDMECMKESNEKRLYEKKICMRIIHWSLRNTQEPYYQAVAASRDLK